MPAFLLPRARTAVLAHEGTALILHPKRIMLAAGLSVTLVATFVPQTPPQPTRPAAPLACWAPTTEAEKAVAAARARLLRTDEWRNVDTATMDLFATVQMVA